MAIAVTTREGTVAGIGQARNITVSALRTLEKAIGRNIQQKHTRAFSIGGHQMHGGAPWLPLSPATVAIKAKLGYPNPASPLVRSGKMATSQRVKVQLSAVGDSVQYRIWVWNNVPYSGYHMKPTWNHWVGRYNPKRPPVDLTAQDLEFAIHLIEGAMAGAGTPAKRVREKIVKLGAGVANAVRRTWNRGASAIGAFFGFLFRK